MYLYIYIYMYIYIYIYLYTRVRSFSCGVADIIANDETLLSVERTLKQAICWTATKPTAPELEGI